MTTPTKEDIIRVAEEAHAKYPQYRGRWRGPEWKLVLIRRNIRTKAGMAFKRGDVTIARPDRAGFVLAYSVNNGVDTLLPQRDTVPLMDLQRFVAVRTQLEQLATRLGAKELKSACCNLVLDDGDGKMARRALGDLRQLPFAHDGVTAIIHELEEMLEAA